MSQKVPCAFCGIVHDELTVRRADGGDDNPRRSPWWPTLCRLTCEELGLLSPGNSRFNPTSWTTLCGSSLPRALRLDRRSATWLRLNRAGVTGGVFVRVYTTMSAPPHICTRWTPGPASRGMGVRRDGTLEWSYRAVRQGGAEQHQPRLNKEPAATRVWAWRLANTTPPPS